MERKIIQLSPSTSVISLPSSWVKSNNLKKGASLSVEVNENNLVVSPEKEKTLKEIEIDLSKFEGRLMWVAIDTAYTAGYDSIKIKTKNAEQSSFMTKVVRYFPGMMIVSERNNYVHFKSMEDSPMSINKILDRIFNLNISLIEDSIESIDQKEWDTILKIKYRDYVINSYISYCFRAINKVGYAPFSKIGPIHSLIKIIEIFSDKLCVLFESIGHHKAKSIKGDTLKQILEMYRKFWTLHTKFSTDKVLSLEEERIKLIKSVNKMPAYTLSVLTDLTDLFFAINELEMQLNS